MMIKVVPVRVSELQLQLREYEAEFGMPTARFAELYSSGQLPDDDEDRYLDWFMTYDAWSLATDALRHYAECRPSTSTH